VVYIYRNCKSLFCLLHIFLTGFEFWGKPARQIFAVPIGDLRDEEPSSEEESEVFATPAAKKRKLLPSPQTTENSAAARDQPTWDEGMVHLLSEIGNVKSTLGIITNSLIHRSWGSWGAEAQKLFIDDVKSLVLSTFMCTLCRKVPAAVPASVTTCCERIIGCASCVDKYYDEKTTCPLCDDQTGKEKCYEFRGLSHFLEKTRDLFTGEKEKDSTTIAAEQN